MDKQISDLKRAAAQSLHRGDVKQAIQLVRRVKYLEQERLNSELDSLNSWALPEQPQIAVAS